MSQSQGTIMNFCDLFRVDFIGDHLKTFDAVRFSILLDTAVIISKDSN